MIFGYAVLLAAVTQCLVLMLVAGGEGWGAPFYPNLFNFLVYPYLASVVRGPTSIRRNLYDTLIVVVWSLLSVWIWYDVASSDRPYFQNTWNVAADYVLAWGISWLITPLAILWLQIRNA